MVAPPFIWRLDDDEDDSAYIDERLGSSLKRMKWNRVILATTRSYKYCLFIRTLEGWATQRTLNFCAIVPSRSSYSWPWRYIGSDGRFHSLTNTTPSYVHISISVRPSFNYRLRTVHRDDWYFWRRSGPHHNSSLMYCWFKTIVSRIITIYTDRANWCTSRMTSDARLYWSNNWFGYLRLDTTISLAFIVSLLPFFYLKQTKMQTYI